MILLSVDSGHDLSCHVLVSILFMLWPLSGNERLGTGTKKNNYTAVSTTFSNPSSNIIPRFGHLTKETNRFPTDSPTSTTWSPAVEGDDFCASPTRIWRRNMARQKRYVSPLEFVCVILVPICYLLIRLCVYVFIYFIDSNTFNLFIYTATEWRAQKHACICQRTHAHTCWSHRYM